MSTYTKILYHIVFSTKNREPSLLKNNRDALFKYITGILINNKCYLYQIGGVFDHIHIITQVHPTITLSKLIKDIKIASSNHITAKHLFPNYSGWQDGYGAFTYSFKDKERLIEYVKNQEEHHHIKTYKEEFIDLLNEHGIDFDEKYLL